MFHECVPCPQTPPWRGRSCSGHLEGLERRPENYHRTRLPSFDLCICVPVEGPEGRGRGGHWNARTHPIVWNSHFCVRPIDNIWDLEMGPEGPLKTQHPTFCVSLTVLTEKSRQSRKSHVETPKSPSKFRFNTFVSEFTPFYVILPLFGPFSEKKMLQALMDWFTNWATGFCAQNFCYTDPQTPSQY